MFGRRCPVLALLAVVAPLAACALAPTEQTTWPIEVVPAGDGSGRVVAVPPSCGSVPEGMVTAFTATPWHDPSLGIGCATSRNLGAVIDDPRDLLRGRTLGPADAGREAAAVNRYREGKEKALARQGTSTAYSGASASGEK